MALPSSPDSDALNNKYKLCWLQNNVAELRDEHLVNMKFSPCGQMIAIATKTSIKILHLSSNGQDAKTAEISSYKTNYFIEDVKWSPDSKVLMLTSFSESSVELVNGVTMDKIISIREPKNYFLSSTYWSPDSKSVVILSKYGMFPLVYSIFCGKRHILPNFSTCLDGSPLMSFSPDGQYMAIIQFIAPKYHLVLFSTTSWKILWKNKLDEPIASGILWSYSSLMIAVWFYSLDFHLQIFEINGQYCQPLRHRGKVTSVVKTVEFSPCSKLLAVMCEDEEEIIVCLFNLLTWQLAAILDYQYPSVESLKEERILVYCYGKSGSTAISSLPEHRNTDILTFSMCGMFLAASQSRGLVYVWNLSENCSLYSIFNTGSSRILDLKWHPHKTHLAVIAPNVIIISKISHLSSYAKKAYSIPLMESMKKQILSVEWSGDNLLLSTADKCLPKIAAILLKKKRKFCKTEKV